MEQKSGCLACGKDLVYLEIPVESRCIFCGKEVISDTRCVDGHFICDACHSGSANDRTMKRCSTSNEKDPLALISSLMESPQVKMHGPEHHFLVPAVLLCCYYNVIKQPEEKKKKISIARHRAEMVLGGFCGSHGSCGAAMGVGIFMSLITDSNPLADEPWSLSNLATARALEKIALIGGPRCCKRDSFLAIISAVNFVKEHFDVIIPMKREISCGFTRHNKECLLKRCPFHPCHGRDDS